MDGVRHNREARRRGTGFWEPQGRADRRWEPNVLRNERGPWLGWSRACGQLQGLSRTRPALVHCGWGPTRGLSGHQWPVMSLSCIRKLREGDKDHSCPEWSANIVSSLCPHEWKWMPAAGGGKESVNRARSLITPQLRDTLDPTEELPNGGTQSASGTSTGGLWVDLTRSQILTKGWSVPISENSSPSPRAVNIELIFTRWRPLS